MNRTLAVIAIWCAVGATALGAPPHVTDVAFFAMLGTLALAFI